MEKIRKFADWDPSRFDALAAELVAAHPDVVLVAGVPATRAMQKATRTIPIFTVVDDPVGNGFARTLARPGGNITGLSEGGEESAQMHISLLRAALPKMNRIVTLSGNEADFVRKAIATFIKAAERAGIAVDVRTPKTRKELEGIVDPLRPGASAIYLKWVNNETGDLVAQLGLARRIAVTCQEEELVARGALLSFRMVVAEDAQFSAALDRLLRGANPAETPFELPNRSVFAINRKTASAIGVTFPPDFAVRADKVVD